MPGKKRAAPTENEDVMEQPQVQPTVSDDVGMEEGEEEEEEEDEEDEEIHDGDELQEVTFDVNAMEPSDADATFHMLQRWVPLTWCIDMDDIITSIAESTITSIVKVPEDVNKDPGVDLGDENDVLGILGVVHLTDENLKKYQGVNTLLRKLSAVGSTDEPTKTDISTLFTPESRKKHPVALIVNERLVNLPKELGSQLHVNMFTELAGLEAEKALPVAEYFVVIIKVRLNADKEADVLEQEEAAAKNLPASGPKKKTKRAKPVQEVKTRPAISEETALFGRAEEIMYFRNRDPAFAVKRFILDETSPNDVVVAPVVVHRSKLSKLVADIKTLDSYFLLEGQS
ncbi:Protein BCP1 [Diplonema papillatum]|nr:Protein BCP1 [Diplonema papillatum]KAJ9442016.1 Protein BCP1 [Diplonema papillatum]|eukprot:gene16305-24981_t